MTNVNYTPQYFIVGIGITFMSISLISNALRTQKNLASDVSNDKNINSTMTSEMTTFAIIMIIVAVILFMITLIKLYYYCRRNHSIQYASIIAANNTSLNE